MRPGRALLAVAALACGHVEVPAGTAERATEQCRDHSESLPATAFSTDGCSAWPDGSWLACCIEHDIAYWCGGTKVERVTADLELRRCVAQERSEAFAWLTWTGVRMGGHPALPLPWRWGYGRPWPTSYSQACEEACEEAE